MNRTGKGFLFHDQETFSKIGFDRIFDNSYFCCFAALVVAWSVRAFSSPRKAYHEIRAAFLVYLILNWSSAVEATKRLISSIPYDWLHKAVAGVAVITSVVLLGSLSLKEREPTTTKEDGDFEFLRPMMIPCRTTHTRLFPTKHSFSYSYLYAGIPVGWRGPAGSILSADNQLSSKTTSKRQTWFDVTSEDYLERGRHPDGLSGKLREYLQAQGVAEDRFTHAYLVTAPRFLGFSFNPVSFWYLYDHTRSLKAMILEVNNTFDERRMYYLETEAETHPSDPQSQPQEDSINFTHSWPKDFHVSPFNDRGGSYSATSTDPFKFHPSSHKIENTIVLKSPEGTPKIVARVFSSAQPLDAEEMSRWGTMYFVLRWWWVGFMTNPRILREARILWVKKLQLYYRPEVFGTSIGRNETREEAALESFFRFLLQELVAEMRIPIRYTPAAGASRGKPSLVAVAGAKDEASETEPIDIRILTPAFYSELVRCSNVVDAFKSYCFNASEGTALLEISESESQREAFKKALTRYCTSLEGATPRGLKWRNMMELRYITAVSLMFEATAAWRRPSNFDTIVLASQISAPQRAEYQRAALMILCADRLAFGWTFVLRFYGWCVWFGLVCLAATQCGRIGSTV